MLSMPESWRQDSLASGDEALKAGQLSEGEDREPHSASEAALLEKSQLSERLKAAEDDMVGTSAKWGLDTRCVVFDHPFAPDIFEATLREAVSAGNLALQSRDKDLWQ